MGIIHLLLFILYLMKELTRWKLLGRSNKDHSFGFWPGNKKTSPHRPLRRINVTMLQCYNGTDPVSVSSYPTVAECDVGAVSDFSNSNN